MKIILSIFFVLPFLACASQKRVQTSITSKEVYFGFARDSVQNNALTDLESSLVVLKNDPKSTATIEGHTDPIGSSDYNLELGDRRAHDVLHYLISNGVDPERLTSVSYGEERPKNLSNQKENRRAVIKITQVNKK